MRTHYDFSKMKGRKNPYAKNLKRQITIRIGTETLNYFREMADTTGVPYQNLIDAYLADCVSSHKKLHMKWA
jgi:predicted DNA binding CopG/RHH family protein